MAQWIRMTQMLQHLPYETVSSLYPPTSFPIEVRHYIADWIEKQKWEDFSVETMEHEFQAENLLDQAISILQTVALQNTNVVERMKLVQMSRNMEMFRQQPLKFVVMVRDILRQERALISRNNPSHPQTYEMQDVSMQDVDHLVLKVLSLQDIRKNLHQVQEELNWERQNYESLTASFQQNGMDRKAEIQALQANIKQLEFRVQTLTLKQNHLLKECVDCLGNCQTRFIDRLKDWVWEQRKAAIGFPFDDNLTPLQTWCEQLLGMNGNLRQELMLTGEMSSDLQERLSQLLQVLIQSSFIVDKQPPQVIKTQSKFSTTVRYLLGEKVAPGKPVVVKAQIINEMQARNLGSVPSDNVAELINNSAVLEHNVATKSTCANFRNMSIKKIKRADRKGSESVTEEKFALLFMAEITITGCDTPYRIQVISQPVVVIVHGSQDNNAVATIIWDCAFSERDRVPFVVPERVPWRMMYNTLNSKFTSEVGTPHNLDQYNQHFLAQKIFDKPDYAEDFSNMMVSWAQFNKEVLPGRMFTFWQWFDGVIELTKKHLKSYWSEGLIFGFIGKQHLHLILKDRPNGTFLLRFSDSEIGGITIAYVSPSENGGQKIQNIQPFSKRDLEIRGLGDRIRDIDHITYLYPDYSKHDVFRKFYTEPQVSTNTGYIPVSLQLKVGMDAPPPASASNAAPGGSTFIMDTVPSPQVSFPVDAAPSGPSMVAAADAPPSNFSLPQFPSPFNQQEFSDEMIEATGSSSADMDNMPLTDLVFEF